MKNYLILLFTSLSAAAFAQTGSIQVEISNIKNSDGIIGLALYNNAADFTKKEFKTTEVKARKGKVTASFDKVPAGTYAIAVLHDENENNAMDFNMLGIPKEAFGFSNNAKAVLSPPKFSSAAFAVKNGETRKLGISL